MDPMERVWTAEDPEYRKARASVAERRALAGRREPKPEALVESLEGLGWQVRYGLPDPQGGSGRYAYALKDLPPELGSRHGIYRRGETDGVALVMVLHGVLQFEDLLAMPSTPEADRHSASDRGGVPRNPAGSAEPFPSGGERTIAILALEPPELAAGYDVDFREGIDDLDVLRYAWIHAPSGTPLLLVKHLRAPFPGTEVHADYQADAAELTRQLLRRFDLDENDLLWQTDIDVVRLESPHARRGERREA